MAPERKSARSRAPSRAVTLRCEKKETVVQGAEERRRTTGGEGRRAAEQAPPSSAASGRSSLIHSLPAPNAPTECPVSRKMRADMLDIRLYCTDTINKGPLSRDMFLKTLLDKSTLEANCDEEEQRVVCWHYLMGDPSKREPKQVTSLFRYFKRMPGFRDVPPARLELVLSRAKLHRIRAGAIAPTSRHLTVHVLEGGIAEFTRPDRDTDFGRETGEQRYDALLSWMDELRTAPLASNTACFGPGDVLPVRPEAALVVLPSTAKTDKKLRFAEEIGPVEGALHFDSSAHRWQCYVALPGGAVVLSYKTPSEQESADYRQSEHTSGYSRARPQQGESQSRERLDTPAKAMDQCPDVPTKVAFEVAMWGGAFRVLGRAQAVLSAADSSLRPKRALLLREGEAPQEVFFILAGEVRVTRCCSMQAAAAATNGVARASSRLKRKVVEICRLGPGAWLGALACHEQRAERFSLLGGTRGGARVITLPVKVFREKIVPWVDANFWVEQKLREHSWEATCRTVSKLHHATDGDASVSSPATGIAGVMASKEPSFPEVPPEAKLRCSPDISCYLSLRRAPPGSAQHDKPLIPRGTRQALEVESEARPQPPAPVVDEHIMDEWQQYIVRQARKSTTRRASETNTSTMRRASDDCDEGDAGGWVLPGCEHRKSCKSRASAAAPQPMAPVYIPDGELPEAPDAWPGDVSWPGIPPWPGIPWVPEDNPDPIDIDGLSSTECESTDDARSATPPPDPNVVLDVGDGQCQPAGGHRRQSWEASAKRSIAMSQKKRSTWAKSQQTESGAAAPVSRSPAATPSKVLHRPLSCSRASTRAPTPSLTERSATPALTDRPCTPMSQSVPRSARSPSPTPHDAAEEAPGAEGRPEWTALCPQLGAAIPPPGARRPKSAGNVCSGPPKRPGCSRSMFAYRSARQPDDTIGRLIGQPPQPPPSDEPCRPATPGGPASVARAAPLRA